ncbi:MAG: J domain-containing protein [Candidatus Margulisbacteria bacterium]|nr:J domain-containing protein [Candidatus Margulisiibacteriota bacterium]
MKDPYNVLSVKQEATDAEIKSSYRKLSKKYHPDLNPNNKDSEKKFKEINDAYETIRNKECREKYEQEKQYKEYANQSQQQNTGRQRPFYYETQSPHGRYSSSFSSDYENIFANLFRGESNDTNLGNDLPGQDVQYSLKISFEDAVLGAEKELVLNKGKTIKAKIPPGITEGTVLRFKGQGSPDSKQKNHGNAYVKIQVEPSSIFKKAGNDLIIEVPVTLYEAILGAKIEVPVVGGKATVTVPAGVNSGTKLRLKNKGYRQKAKTNQGNQIVEIIVTLPDKIDDKLANFMKQWATEHQYKPRK